MKKVAPIAAAGYAAAFVLFCYLLFLERRTGIRAFAVPFLFALAYNRRNQLILYPLFLGAAMLVDFGWQTAVIAAVPCLGLGALYFVHYRLKKNVRLVAVQITLAVAAIPVIVFGAVTVDGAVRAALSVLFAQLFLYAFVTVLYFLFVRKAAFLPTDGERIALIASIGVLGGIATLEIGWFKPFFLIASFAVTAALLIGQSAALIVGAGLGVGAGIATGNPALTADAVALGCAAAVFDRKSLLAVPFALTAAFFVAGYLFGEATPYLGLIAPFVGSAAVCLIPPSVKEGIRMRVANIGQKTASKSVVNRERQRAGEKLGRLGAVFGEMGDILSVEAGECNRKEDLTRLTRVVAGRCCDPCPYEEQCRKALGGEGTDIVVSELVAAAMDTGKATILDTPPFLSARCKRINGLITATNEAAEQYADGEIRKSHIEEGREMLASQLEGLKRVLKGMEEEMKAPLVYDNETEQKVVAALQAASIVASEAVVYGKEKPDEITVTVPSGDRERAVQAVMELFENRVTLVRAEEAGKGNTALQFGKAPVYSVVYGARNLAAEPEAASGDRLSAIRLEGGKVMLVLSDGMGSGNGAYRNSGYALGLIEHFYRAGFDHMTVVSAVGRLLSLRSKEEFNAVDIAVIDTVTGSAEFIKVGGRESFIVRKGLVDVVESDSLPIGILEEVEAVTERRRLFPNTFIVMVSDGVIDVLGREKLIELLGNVRSGNPDEVAATVMEATVREAGKERDDASVLVGKIFIPR